MKIEPTMNDRDVIDFISKGIVILEGIVSDDINRQCDDLPGNNLSEFVQREEFIRGVFLHPEAAGVARSLLGEDFLVPYSANQHLFEAPHRGQTWHSDGISEPGYGITHLQCYYYPQEVKIEDGPTMALPGSHQRLVDREAIAHYKDILGQQSLTVPAGTVVLTHYGIWHKAGPKVNSKRRGMIKFSYFRNSQPKRDWLIDEVAEPPGHWPRHAYATEIEFYRDSVHCRRTWDWMCGKESWEPDDKWIRSFLMAKPLSEVLSSF